MISVFIFFSPHALAVPADLTLAKASKLIHSLSDQYSMVRMNKGVTKNLPGFEFVHMETDRKKVSFDSNVDQNLGDGFKALALYSSEGSDFVIVFADDSHQRLVHLSATMSLTDSPFLDESSRFYDLLVPMPEVFEMPSDERLLSLVLRSASFYRDALEALRRKLGYLNFPRACQEIGRKLGCGAYSVSLIPPGVSAVMTGYSLGGLVAQLVSLSDERLRVEEGVSVVTFNSPGALEFAFRKALIKDPEVLRYEKDSYARHFTWMDRVLRQVGWVNEPLEREYLLDVLGFASTRLRESLEIRNVGREDDVVFTGYGVHIGEMESKSGDLLGLVTLRESLRDYARHTLENRRNTHSDSVGSFDFVELGRALTEENFERLYELIFCQEARQKVYHQRMHQHSLDLLIEMISRESE